MNWVAQRGAGGVPEAIGLDQERCSHRLARWRLAVTAIAVVLLGLVALSTFTGGDGSSSPDTVGLVIALAGVAVTGGVWSVSRLGRVALVAPLAVLAVTAFVPDAVASGAATLAVLLWASIALGVLARAETSLTKRHARRAAQVLGVIAVVVGASFAAFVLLAPVEGPIQVVYSDRSSANPQPGLPALTVEVDGRSRNWTPNSSLDATWNSTSPTVITYRPAATGDARRTFRLELDERDLDWRLRGTPLVVHLEVDDATASLSVSYPDDPDQRTRLGRLDRENPRQELCFAAALEFTRLLNSFRREYVELLDEAWPTGVSLYFSEWAQRARSIQRFLAASETTLRSATDLLDPRLNTTLRPVLREYGDLESLWLRIERASERQARTDWNDANDERFDQQERLWDAVATFRANASSDCFG